MVATTNEKIGKTLKQYRLHAHLTQKEMAAGVVTESFYSKVERSVHSIKADTLIDILIAHHFDVIDFFTRLGYQDKIADPNYPLQVQISFAQNRKDLQALDKIAKKIKNEGVASPSFWLEISLQNAYAWILHSNEMVSPKMKEKFKSVILNDDWNRKSYHYLSQGIVLLDIDEAFPLVKSAFEAYKKNKENDIFTLQFVSLIAVNYLNCCYHQKANKEYARLAIDFLKMLPVDPVIGFYRIIGAYYESVFSHNNKMRDMIIEILKNIGYYTLIQDTVEDLNIDK